MFTNSVRTTRVTSLSSQPAAQARGRDRGLLPVASPARRPCERDLQPPAGLPTRRPWLSPRPPEILTLNRPLRGPGNRGHSKHLLLFLFRVTCDTAGQTDHIPLSRFPHTRLTSPVCFLPVII